MRFVPLDETRGQFNRVSVIDRHNAMTLKHRVSDCLTGVSPNRVLTARTPIAACGALFSGIPRQLGRCSAVRGESGNLEDLIDADIDLK